MIDEMKIVCSAIKRIVAVDKGRVYLTEVLLSRAEDRI